MNKVLLMGRLARDPEIRYSQGQQQTAIARFTLAVDRRGRNSQEQQQTADFISCISFNKTAEIVEKYLKQGSKIAVSGRLQTGSYTNKEGQRVYTTDVLVEEIEFAESKSSQTGNAGNTGNSASYTAPTQQPGYYTPEPGADTYQSLLEGEPGYEDLPFN